MGKKKELVNLVSACSQEAEGSEESTHQPRFKLRKKEDVQEIHRI
jgi:hypothetical protein